MSTDSAPARDHRTTGATAGRAPADGPAPPGEAITDPTVDAVRRPMALLRSSGAIAMVTWLVTLPAAMAAPSVLNLDPFTQRDADMPLAACSLATLVLVAIALRRRGPVVIGVAAGLFASLAALILRTAVSGTPFGHEGVYGDTGRLSAMAMRYTVDWASSDGIVGDVASEYPPLYPYLIGKASLLLGVPAWRLLGPAEALAVSASVVVAFVLWARLAAPAVALVISALGLMVFGVPSKAYEVIVLAAFVPLVLITLARPMRGRRPHWLLAGIIWGAVCLTYHAFVAFAAIGLAVLVVWTWRREPDRRSYVGYLVRMAVVAAVVTSWYTLPYLWAMATGGQQIADMYQSREISEPFLGFLQPYPHNIAQLAGGVALVWYLRSTRWALPLLLIVAGSCAYQAIGMVRWVATGHTGLFYYSRPLIDACLVAGAVLGAAEAVPALARRTRRQLEAAAGVAVTTVVLFACAFGYWSQWMPANHWFPTDDGHDRVDWRSIAYSNELALQAHLQPFPDGGRPRYAPTAGSAGIDVPAGEWRYLPVEEIRRLTRAVRPRDVTPSVVSYDEQLYAFLPWRGYLGVDRNASYGPVRWIDRYEELRRLAATTDPGEFARRSAGTRFGAIDVFVLRSDGNGNGLLWKALRVPETVRFTREQFDPRSFVVMEAGAGAVVAVRRP